MEDKRIKMIADLYRGSCGELKELSTGAEFEDRARKLLEAGQGLFATVDYYEVFWLANESAFLKGGGKRGWKADFLWLITPENMLKVLTEQYTPHSSPLERKSRRDFLRLWSEAEEKAADVSYSGRGGDWIRVVDHSWMD